MTSHQFLLPPRLTDALNRYTARTGLKRSEVVRQALTRYLSDKGVLSPSSSSSPSPSAADDSPSASAPE